uniref:PID domain-containing protein n=1 Tax=Hucho hucho TaxID=62062 RepID=A0A4W5JJA2_9TELE
GLMVLQDFIDGSSPSSVGLANRSGPPAAPPTSLSLRSSYNQLLGCDVIKESPTAMEMGSSATLPKSRHRYAMTSVHSAMGLSDTLAPPSSSSSALYSSSSSSFFSTNPKLAKNGANLQRKAETQQQEQSKTNTEFKVQDDIITPIHSSDWQEGEKDNSQAPPPFGRRTKSFLEFHEKEVDPPSVENKEEECPNKEEGEEEEEDEKHSCPEKDQVSPDKERERTEDEKQTPKQEDYLEEEGATPTKGAPKLVSLRTKVESPLEDEDSSWTTLSQESPSPQTPQEIGERIIFWFAGCLFAWVVGCLSVCLFELKDYPVYPDPSLKAFEGATLRYSFPVRSLGWVEMAERDLTEGRSSVAVHHCIRQLSYCRRDIQDSAGVWGEGKDMLLVLQDRDLTLVDPDDHSLLHSQPISSIRVWGVGRDHDRDFAYVARDKTTRVLKCHVFRCDTPAEAIATSLHEICSKIMAERKSAKAAAGSSSQTGSDVPLQEFPMPKTELVQKFHVHYLGMTSVSRPIGKRSKETTNTAVPNHLHLSRLWLWPGLNQDVDMTVGLGLWLWPGLNQDVDMTVGLGLWLWPGLNQDVGMKLRYQKCLVARPPSQRAGSSSPPPDSVTRRVTTSVKRGVQSLIDTLKTKKPPSELPQQ